MAVCKDYLPKAFPRASLVPRFALTEMLTHPNHIAFKFSELIDGLFAGAEIVRVVSAKPVFLPPNIRLEVSPSVRSLCICTSPPFLGKQAN